MFDPDEFWRFAESLISGNADECACRVAAGRAYYAMFLTLYQRVQGRPGVHLRGDRQDHGYLVKLLFERNRVPMAEALKGLGRLREKADYDLGYNLRLEEVSFAVDQYRAQYENAKAY